MPHRQEIHFLCLSLFVRYPQGWFLLNTQIYKYYHFRVGGNYCGMPIEDETTEKFHK
jgi:hypothetical protein